MTTSWTAYHQPDPLDDDDRPGDRHAAALYAKYGDGPGTHPDHHGRVVCMELDDIKAWMDARARQRTEQEETNASDL